jgi:hypothetical protein
MAWVYLVFSIAPFIWRKMMFREGLRSAKSYTRSLHPAFKSGSQKGFTQKDSANCEVDGRVLGESAVQILPDPMFLHLFLSAECQHLLAF